MAALVAGSLSMKSVAGIWGSPVARSPERAAGEAPPHGASATLTPGGGMGGALRGRAATRPCSLHAASRRSRGAHRVSTRPMTNLI
jgi:hypothetical protein